MYCFLLNIIALRGTPQDADEKGDHISAAKEFIVTPVEVNDLHHAIKRYCHPNIDELRKDGLSLVLTTEKGQYHYTDTGTGPFGNMRRPVPQDTFVYITNKNEVAAWVQVKHMDERGHWSPMTDRTMFLDLTGRQQRPHSLSAIVDAKAQVHNGSVPQGRCLSVSHVSAAAVTHGWIGFGLGFSNLSFLCRFFLCIFTANII